MLDADHVDANARSSVARISMNGAIVTIGALEEVVGDS
jgi:hypothetical protein